MSLISHTFDGNHNGYRFGAEVPQTWKIVDENIGLQFRHQIFSLCHDS